VKVSIVAENQLGNILPGAIALFMALSEHKTYVVNLVYFVMFTTLSVLLTAAIVYGQMLAVAKIDRLMFTDGSILVANGVH
jgi:hypothetical protein